MAKLIKVDGSITDVEPKNGTDFQLQEMYDLLGVDMIEIVPVFTGQILVVDEEGLLKENPILNDEIYLNFGLDIAGDVLLCNNDQVR